jgi:pimeloyl-ACP methyl ester carboxylesterase
MGLVAVAAASLLWAASAAAAPIAWKACKGAAAGLQCARVAVPLDWSQPGGRTISLSVIRRPASRPAKRIGSLFVNFGGPGVAGVSTVKRIGPRLNRLGDGRFDVVSWDPRGTGESTHISCFANDREQLRFWGAYAIPVTPAQSERFVRKTTAFAGRCTERSRDLLPFVSTADTVRDLDHLRELVGDPQLNYRGVSYGTFIGQTYANLFPDRVRAMVLDANINPLTYTQSVEAAIAGSNTDTDLVIDKFLALCKRAGPSRCALARGGSPARRFARLLARLRRGPIPAPSANPPRLTYSDLLIRIFTAEGAPAGWPDFARELNQAARGDGSAMAQVVQGATPMLEDALNSAVGLQCADKPVRPSWAPAHGPTSCGD